MDNLIKNLRILNLSKQDQIDYLINLGTYPIIDEIIIDYFDSYDLFNVQNLANELNYNNNINNYLIEINYIFDNMSNQPAEVWNINSLNSEDWFNIRLLAKKTLMILDSLKPMAK